MSDCFNTDKLFDLEGKKALVTGSSRGIGRALALGLAKNGADIIIHCASNTDKAKIVTDKIKEIGRESNYIAADLSSATGTEKLYNFICKEFGEIDILVLNASVQYRKNWLEIDSDQYDKQMRVNVKSSLELIQYFTPVMIDKGWGRIVTIGSVQQNKPHPDMLVYAASKMAQLSMVKNLSKQLAGKGITVNNLAPGVIDTDRNTEALADEDYLEILLKKIPADFIGQPEDCVGALLMLCSKAGRYITGEDIYIDGGMQL